MKETPKDTLATGSQSQQAQANQYGSTPSKVATPSPRKDTRDEEEEEEQPQNASKQYDSQERDGKTSPQQAQPRREEEQGKTAGQSSEPNKTQKDSQQQADQKRH